MDEVQAHPSSSHLGTVSQDTAVHFEFASLVEVRHEAVILRELKLTILAVVKEYDGSVFFQRVGFGGQMARFLAKEVDDDGSAMSRLLEGAGISRNKERVTNGEQVVALHPMRVEIRLDVEVDSFILDVASERFVQSVGVERREQVLAEVPYFGNVAMCSDIDPADDAADGQVNEVRNVAQHLRVVRHHLPLNRVAGERFFCFDCVD